MSIVNNSSVNYTNYYRVLDYFKTIMTNHPSIQYVSQGDLFSIDTKSFPAYPMGNILITSSTFDGSTSVYSCQLLVADKHKEKNNESDGETNAQRTPFFGTDDIVDIHANTLGIINDLISFTQFGTTNFDIDGTTFCEAFVERYDNGLAGWTANFNLITHNDRDRCLFNLFDEGDVSRC
jgi:hypothetical protein